MGLVTAVVTLELRDRLRSRDDLVVIRDELWVNPHYVIPPHAQTPVLMPELRFLEFMHPDAPDGRHVDVILDERGLRFKPDADV